MPPPASAAAAEVHPYLRTHGKAVARLHLLDWVVLLLLVAMYGVLGLVQPFHRFVAQDMMASLRYPMKDNTVPSWAVPVIAIVVPMVFVVGVYMKRRNVYDLHHAILGLLFSVLITAILTVAIKDAVGRPRPDFFWRCFPDGVPTYATGSRAWSERATRASRLAIPLAVLLGLGSCRGTWPARSRLSIGEAMSPSSASSSCLCFWRPWLQYRE